MLAHTGHRGAGSGTIGLLMQRRNEEIERDGVKGTGRCERVGHANKPVQLNEYTAGREPRECTGEAGTFADRWGSGEQVYEVQRKGGRRGREVKYDEPLYNLSEYPYEKKGI